jgi:riboflavin kinase/FMN adenylyltransferase
MSQRPSVVSVGNFDGVHRGHQALLAAARAESDRRQALLTVVCFQRHPNTLLAPERVPPALMDVTQRTASLLACGVDQIEWLSPEPRVLEMTAEQFVERVVERLSPVAWCEGPDFRFGKGRAGDLALLRDLGERKGFEVFVIEPAQATLMNRSIVTVHSSLIRWLIAQGRVADAHRCLGRPWAIRGQVVRGEQRGRALGCPTANLQTDGLLLPADGVYAGRSEIDGRDWPVALSVGSKPTFGHGPRAVEAHLIGFTGDLYGRTIQVDVLRWLREQVVYAGLEPLIAQIRLDIRAILDFNQAGWASPAECAAT